MKKTYRQFLLLAGFYFVISLIMGYFENDILNIINIALLLLFIVLFFLLLCKKSFSFLERFQNQYPRTSNFLYAFGFVKYLQIIFLDILTCIEDYNASMAQYYHIEYISPYADLLTVIAAFILLILIGALLWATYVSFIKPFIKKA